MADYSNSITILINAKDNASDILKASAAGIQGTATSLQSYGSTLSSIGSTMTKNITLPIVGIAAASSMLAVKFQQDMEMLHTNAGVAQSAIAGLSNQILDMAGKVGQSPEALAKAFYHVASAGTGIWSTAQQLDILKVAAEGANIGVASLDDTTYALTSAMASGIKGVSNASQMMAELTAIVGAGDMKLQDLNGAIGTGFLSTAATFGISIQSVGTALATLTDNGEHADEAATRLRMTWALMTSPSAMATKQLAALGLTASDAKTATGEMSAVFAKSGLSTTKLANDLRQPNGITVALTDLKTHLQDAGLSASETDAMLSKAFGGGRTDAALLTLLNNLDRMNAKYTAINANAGQFANNLASQQQTAAQKLKDAWAGVEAQFTKLGEAILPSVTKLLVSVAHGVETLTGWFNKLTSGQKQFVTDAAAMLAVAGPVLLIFGKMATAVSSLITLNKTLGVVMGAEAVEGQASMGALGLAVSRVAGVFAAARAGIMGLSAATLASGAAMAGVFAGLVVDIGLVYKAIQSVIGAYSAVKQANAAARSDQASINSAHQQIVQLSKSGTPDQKARADKLLAQGFAGGTDFAPGGIALVGEEGPELINLPRGSQVIPTPQTQQILSSSAKNVTGSGGSTGSTTVNLSVNIGNYMGSAADQQAVAKQIWQALQNISRQHGLAANLPMIGILPR
jgi:TP901 family phage tail tape measure protein